MSVTTLNSNPSGAAAKSAAVSAPSVRSTKQTLSQQDFLKLLTIQLKNQDPMKPMDDNSFVTTMAQFTGLEQNGQMLSYLKQMGASSKVMAASSVIGRDVTVRDSNGNESAGQVEAVETTDNGVMVKIANKLYPFDDVVRVAPVTQQKPS